MIEYSTRPHHVLLIMKSNNACAKTAASIAMITTSPIEDVDKAFKTLAVEGLITSIDLVQWKITPAGERELIRLAQKKVRAIPDTTAARNRESR